MGLIQWKHLTQLGQGNRTQRPHMGKDHIWDSTQWDRETGPKDHRIQHSWDRETRSKDHIWAKTIYGIQHSGTRKPDPKTIGFNTVGTGKPDPKTIYGQRPYMGFNTVGQGNRTQRPSDSTQLGQGNQIQRPYMGKDHIWDSTQWDRETGPKDHRIQHSWDRETRPKDHIWAKTIYGIQHSWTGKPDPKTIGFNTVGTGKPDPKTIYGQRPYMGFNTVGQGNRTQRPSDSTQLGQGNQTQRPYMGKDHANS